MLPLSGDLGGGRGLGFGGIGGASRGGGVRSLRSDLLNTMRSQIRYGKATSISSRNLIENPELWSGEFGQVKTLEQLKDAGTRPGTFKFNVRLPKKR
jgi:hypothetical protein